MRLLVLTFITSAMSFPDFARAESCASRLDGTHAPLALDVVADEAESPAVAVFAAPDDQPRPPLVLVGVATPESDEAADRIGARSTRLDRLFRVPGPIDLGLAALAASLAYVEPDRARPAVIGLALVLVYRGLTRVVRRFADSAPTPASAAEASAERSVDESPVHAETLETTLDRLSDEAAASPVIALVPRNEFDWIARRLWSAGYAARPRARGRALVVAQSRALVRTFAPPPASTPRPADVAPVRRLAGPASVARLTGPPPVPRLEGPAPRLRLSGPVARPLLTGPAPAVLLTGPAPRLRLAGPSPASVVTEPSPALPLPRPVPRPSFEKTVDAEAGAVEMSTTSHANVDVTEETVGVRTDDEDLVPADALAPGPPCVPAEPRSRWPLRFGRSFGSVHVSPKLTPFFGALVGTFLGAGSLPVQDETVRAAITESTRTGALSRTCEPTTDEADREAPRTWLSWANSTVPPAAARKLDHPVAVAVTGFALSPSAPTPGRADRPGTSRGLGPDVKVSPGKVAKTKRVAPQRTRGIGSPPMAVRKVAVVVRKATSKLRVPRPAGNKRGGR